MRAITYLAFATIALVGCTNDFDQFSFGAGGAGGAATSAQGGAGPTTSNTTDTTSNTTATTTTTTTTTSTTTSTTAATTAATTATTSGGGLTIDCDGTPCDIDGGDLCCVSKMSQAGTCKSNCQGNETTVTCSQPSDCPGQICCAHGGLPYTLAECVDDCGALGGSAACEPGVTDCGTQSCQQSSYLPSGFLVCKF